MATAACRVLLVTLAALAACDVPPAATAADERPAPATADSGSDAVLRAPVSVTGRAEIIVRDVVIPAGAAMPPHTHPGEEIVYVLEGSAVHAVEGEPDEVLEAGDARMIPAGRVHAPSAGPHGARAIVFRLQPLGEPESVPAAR